MSLWYSRAGSRSKDNGKFRRHPAMGGLRSPASTAGEHQGWYYDIIVHQTGASIRRTSYNASISDNNHHRVEYLRGFSSAAQATEAAKRWIEATLHRMQLISQRGHIGRIPALPTTPSEQATPTAQEK